MEKFYDTMTPEEIRKLYREMKKEHLASEYTLPKKPSSDGFYHLWIKEGGKRKQIKAKTIDGLKEKLYAKNIHTFKTVFALVQEEKLKYIKDPEKKLSASNTVWRTGKDYERYFDGTDFENIPIEEITVSDIDEVCMLNLTRYDLKEKAFLAMRGIIKSVTKYALSQYWSNDDVYARIDFRKYTDMLVRPVDVERRVHSEEELDKIVACLEERIYRNPYCLSALALRLQIAMGLRIGEIPPLTWDDVTEEYVWIRKEQISVKGARENGGNAYKIVNHTKTWKDRKFPITSDVRDVLFYLKRMHDAKYPDSNYLFPGENEGDPVTNNTIYQYYYRMCKSLGIKISREIVKGPHSFRRNAITRTINSPGGTPFMASKLYGNTPNVASKNYYTGLDLAQAKLVLEGNH